jgi:hypothetical protein
MKAKSKLALAVLACVSIGSASAEVIHGHPINTPTVYVILGASVTYPGSGYPCGCRGAEQSGEQGKSARKPHHPQRPADIARRPATRPNRAGNPHRKAIVVA